MNFDEMAVEMHEKHHGKIEVISKVALKDKIDMSVAYTPGVAEPCRRIKDNPEDVYKYTVKGNMVAIVSDGTAVLGLGNIGAAGAIPVMEGKAILFKNFGGVDAFPICLDTTDDEEIIRTVKYMAPVFGGINLEDIAAPRCFYIEKRLKEELDIPVFHDDQHGTAVVTLAAMLNALKLVKKDINEIEVIVNGSGAAGIAITKLLMSMGLKKVILCDTKGAIYEGRDNLNPIKAEMAKISNLELKKGQLGDVIKGADVFVGVSAPNVLTGEMVKTMAKDPLIFAMSNPIPEIMPDVAKAAGVAVMGTGRSDFPNQINNVLAFPGIFRGAFDVRASDINEAMKLAAAKALADFVKPEDLNAEHVIPSAFEEGVGEAVAKAVAQAAIDSGVARI